MNAEQLASLVRTILKIVSGILLTHGLTDTAGLLNAPDVIGAVVLIVSLVWSHFSHSSSPDTSAGGSSKTGGTLGLLLALSVMSASILCGCHSTLAPGGAYAPATISTNAAGTVTVHADTAPDMALFVADRGFKLAWDAIDGVFKFEYDNRAALARQVPTLKPALDELRPQAWDIAQRWAKARAAYKASPNPAGLSQVQTILAEIQRLVPVAQAALVNTNTTTK